MLQQNNVKISAEFRTKMSSPSLWMTRIRSIMNKRQDSIILQISLYTMGFSTLAFEIRNRVLLCPNIGVFQRSTNVGAKTLYKRFDIYVSTGRLFCEVQNATLTKGTYTQQFRERNFYESIKGKFSTHMNKAYKFSTHNVKRRALRYF